MPQGDGSRCSACGRPVDAAAAFCAWCGGAVAEPTLRLRTKLTPLLRQWRALRVDLTRREIRHLLGEPTCLALSSEERWLYEYEAIEQDQRIILGELILEPREGRLQTWTEPDWSRLKP